MISRERRRHGFARGRSCRAGPDEEAEELHRSALAGEERLAVLELEVPDAPDFVLP
jgi:hypothetical protein